MTQQTHFRVYTKKGWKQGLEERFICPCSQPHYSQQQQGRSNASVHERVNKMQSTQRMEYYSAVNREAVLTHATTWMTLKTLCEAKRASHKKTNTVWFRSCEVPGVVRLMVTGSRMGEAAWAVGPEGREWGAVV